MPLSPPGVLITRTQTLAVRSRQAQEFIEISAEVRNVVLQRSFQDGMLTVASQSPTAAVVLADPRIPGVGADALAMLDRLVGGPQGPARGHWGATGAHLKALALGVSKTLVVRGGRLQLSDALGLFVAEFDGPRPLEVQVAFVGT